jgi:hypothetical protein
MDLIYNQSNFLGAILQLEGFSSGRVLYGSRLFQDKNTNAQAYKSWEKYSIIPWPNYSRGES